MFEDEDQRSEKDAKLGDSMATVREKQRKALDEDARKTRREQLQNRRMNNMMKAAEPVPLPNTGVHLSHLEHTPNGELLRPKIIEWMGDDLNPAALMTYLAAVESDDIFQQHFGIIHLRRIVSMKENQPIQAVMDHPVFFKIFKMAQDDVQLHLQLEAAWCLANLASGSTEQTNSLIQKNVIPLFTNLVKSPYSQIVEQAIWGLGNIAGDCTDFRNKVAASHAPEYLLEKFQQRNDENIHNLILWVASNLCRLRPAKAKITVMDRRLLEALKIGFKTSNNVDVLNDCIHGFYSSAKAESSDIFQDFEFILRLQKYYTEIQSDYSNKTGLLSAIHTFLGGFTSNSDDNSVMILQANFLTVLKNSLFIPNPTTVREVCWIMSNMAIGTPEQIKTLLSEPMLFETLLKLCTHQDQHLAKEATWTICNLCLCTDEEVISGLLERGILEMFKVQMESDVEIKMVTLVLEAVIHLLDFYAKLNRQEKLVPFVKFLINRGIGKCIERLQYHKSDLIYLKSHMILETYFPIAN